MPPHHHSAYDALWLDARSSATVICKEPSVSLTTVARISIPTCSEVCHLLWNPAVLRYMWVAESTSHICTLVAVKSGNASSLALPWNGKTPKSRKWPKYKESAQAMLPIHKWCIGHCTKAVQMDDLYTLLEAYGLLKCLNYFQIKGNIH